MPTVAVNDIEIYYEINGEGSPLILIQGWGGNLNAWSQDMVRRLSAQDKVITMDNRGTGRSSKPDHPYTMDMLAGDVSGLLDALGINQAHVMGWSMGGAIAQIVTLRHPEKVKSLILCTSSPGGSHRIPASPETLESIAKISNPSTSDRDRTIALLHLLYPKSYVDTNLEKLIIDETYYDYPTPLYALNRQSQATRGFDSYDGLSSIKVPCLVMTGEEDVMVDPGNSRLLAERIPGARLVTFPGAGHGFLKQVTEKATDEVLNFIKSVDKK